MFSVFKGLFTVLPVLFMAVTSYSSDTKSENYYHNLRFLKKTAPPREMKLIKFDNAANEKPLAIRGVLITYKNRYVKNVFIAGDFSNWKLLTMDRSKYGVWYYLVEGRYIQKDVRYKFNVDGIWIMDSNNPDKVDDGYGSYVSIIQGVHNDEGRYLTYRKKNKNIIEFRLYNPKAGLISIVADFNNWNPESDLLEKDRKGVWRLEKRLARGLYRYKYIIDGEWTADLYNEKTASDGMGGICSVVMVE